MDKRTNNLPIMFLFYSLCETNTGMENNIATHSRKTSPNKLVMKKLFYGNNSFFNHSWLVHSNMTLHCYFAQNWKLLDQNIIFQMLAHFHVNLFQYF
jgi:hypothetical protein